MTDFTDFWVVAKYIRGRLPNPRQPAEKAWDKAIKAGKDPREIIAGYMGFEKAMNECDTDNQYRPQASKFINQDYGDQYLDEPAAQRYLAAPKLEVVG